MVRLWRAKTSIEKVQFLNKHFGLGNYYIGFLRSGKIKPLTQKQKEALQKGKERLPERISKEWHFPGYMGPLERVGSGPWLSQEVPLPQDQILTEEEFHRELQESQKELQGSSSCSA